MSETVSPSALSRSPRRFKFRTSAWIGLCLIAFLLAAVLVIPHFVDLGLFKRTYLPLLEEALGRRIDVDEVHLSVIAGPSIRLSRLTVANSAALGDPALFSAAQVRLKLRLLPLLRGRFEITELVLDRPIFNLLKSADGPVGESEAGTKKAAPNIRREARKKAQAARAGESAAVPWVLPNLVRVRDGELNLLSDGLAPVRIQGIDLRLREFTGAAPFPFRLAFNYAGLKTILLEGQLDYREDKALLELRNNRLTVQELSFPVEGSISNLGAGPTMNLSLASDRVDVKSVFEILAGFGLAPRDFEMSGPMELYMSVAGPSHGLVAQLRGLFKDVKVQSKRAVKGNLRGEVELRLPIGGGSIFRRLEGGGKLAARDGELTNADLIKKIQRATGMIGFSRDQRREMTTFQRLETEFTLRGGSAEISRFYLINPQMEAQGSGTMTLERPTLDMTISAALSPQASARAARIRATARLKNSQGRVVVPLKITGRLENPTVNLHSEKLAESGSPPGAEQNLGALFKGLFRDR